MTLALLNFERGTCIHSHTCGSALFSGLIFGVRAVGIHGGTVVVKARSRIDSWITVGSRNV
ncbi:hypothetical protein RvY_03626 [Ramazzottius varieornatus]|uniref:Uncharacterized protein n=1 Tax=Ramazzottius varieornatus TaxID=947166 RepID=A0A1D1UNQ8_RAMVA|nr:hypothetical protein RvY_03626 [Ramazzottius varieornatus]